MVHFNSPSHSPSNRRAVRSQRRSRPGMHERRSLPRKAPHAFSVDVADGIDVARDTSITLPFEYAQPSPLRRRTFEQSWQIWKAREASAQVERDAEIEAQRDLEKECESESESKRREIESEQCRLFGGDVGDDELRFLGILYNDVSSEAPTIQITEPSYIVKYVQQRPRPRPRRDSQRTRTAIRPSLPLFLSGSLLSENAAIAHFLREAETNPFPKRTTTTTIQHRDHFTVQTPPQSLPPLSESVSESSISYTPDISRSASPFPSPIITIPNDEHDTTWEFLTTTSHTTEAEDRSGVRTPASEPETWILLSDDS